MLNLDTSAEFWFGALILCFHQASKFTELDALSQKHDRRNSVVIGLKASDFAGRSLFTSALVAFIVFTFFTYSILCHISPKLLIGWLKATGSNADLKETIKDTPYPLYIAAAYMGIAQPIVPWMARIGNFQRDLFHAWLGIPRRIQDFAEAVSIQIFVKCTSGKDMDDVAKSQQLEKRKLVSQVAFLKSNNFLNKLADYADINFFEESLDRLDIDEDEDGEKLEERSRYELRTLISQLILISCLSVVRKSGRSGLRTLCRDLDVFMPPTSLSVRDSVSGILVTLIGGAMLWIAIPLLSRPINGIFNKYSPIIKTSWPDTLNGSGQYILSNFLPVILSVASILLAWSIKFETSGADNDVNAQTESVFSIFDKYSSALLTIAFIVVGFDFIQTLYDFGVYKTPPATNAVEFVSSNLVFYVIHATICIAVCLLLLSYVSVAERKNDGIVAGFLKHLLYIAATLGIVLPLSMFYAYAKVQYQLEPGVGGDFVALIVILNCVSALIGFVVADFFFTRRIKSRQRPLIRNLRAASNPSTPLQGSE